MLTLVPIEDFDLEVGGDTRKNVDFELLVPDWSESLLLGLGLEDLLVVESEDGVRVGLGKQENMSERSQRASK